jgi:SAM-dependent methyltransferase
MPFDHNAQRLFVCPHCRGEVITVAAERGFATSLRCAPCGASYPVVGGIPRFVSSDNYAASFGEQWNRHRLTQLDSVTGLPISRQRVFATTRWSERLDGQQILEAGSGAGRFTEVLLSTGADVYSFDYSTAVDANAASHGLSDQLCLFQADIFQIPIRPQAFDKVLCIGVLQHTPDPERAFKSLATQVRPGGELVVDLYPKRLTALLSWKYLLRPITTRMDRQRLLRLIERSVDVLLPLAEWLRRTAGRAGARLLPIVEYSSLGLPRITNREWSVLDTFDMYSPAHDHPQTLSTLARWYQDVGFDHVAVERGPNGIVGRGRRPSL